MLQKGIIHHSHAREIALIPCFSLNDHAESVADEAQGEQQCQSKHMSEQSRIKELETAVAQLETALWGRYFDVLHIVESLVGGHQDAVLCRKRGAHPA